MRYALVFDIFATLTSWFFRLLKWPVLAFATTVLSAGSHIWHFLTLQKRPRRNWWREIKQLIFRKVKNVFLWKCFSFRTNSCFIFIEKLHKADKYLVFIKCCGLANNSVKKVIVTLWFCLQRRCKTFCCGCFYQSALRRQCVLVLWTSCLVANEKN